MSPAEQCRAERHEVRDAMLAISDELVQDTGDKCEGFSMVQADTAGEASLGKEADLGDDELVDLAKPSV